MALSLAGQLRYILLGYLDGLFTAELLVAKLIVDPNLTVSEIQNVHYVIVITFMINFLTAFLAEYAEERLSIQDIERKLFIREGRLLKSKLHELAIVRTFRKALIYGLMSILSSTTLVVTILTLSMMLRLAVLFLQVVLLSVFLSRVIKRSFLTWLGILISASLIILLVGICLPIRIV